MRIKYRNAQNRTRTSAAMNGMPLIGQMMRKTLKLRFLLTQTNWFEKVITLINCSFAERAILQIQICLLYSPRYYAENECLGGRSNIEKAAAADRYSDSCFEELKHANQWRYGSSGRASECTMDALYNEENEIENYVDDMLDDKDASNAAAADGEGLSTSRIEDPSFQSLHPSPIPSNAGSRRRSTGAIQKWKCFYSRFKAILKSKEIPRTLTALPVFMALERYHFSLFFKRFFLLFVLSSYLCFVRLFSILLFSLIIP